MLAAQPLKVPVMLVHSLWDQEDIYGALAVYTAIEPKDTGERQGLPGHRTLAPRPGDRATAARWARCASAATPRLTFRREILRAVPGPVPEGRRAQGRRRAGARAFETGTNTWRRLPAWPVRLRDRLHVRSPRRSTWPAGLKAGFDAPTRGRSRRTTSTSPIRPSPCPSARGPSSPIGYGAGVTWSQWLVDDQREASGRPDVLAFACRTC